MKYLLVLSSILLFLPPLLLAEDQEEYTLVNKQDLAERKKTWQTAVREATILKNENEKLVAKMASHTDELQAREVDNDVLEKKIKQYKDLINLIVYSQPRIWKATGGKTIQAILIADDGNSVTLRTGKEKQVVISREKLAYRDLQFLDALQAAEKEHVVSPKSTPSEADALQQEIEKKLTTVL